MVLLVILKGGQFNLIYNSRVMETFKVLSYKTQKKTKEKVIFGHFRLSKGHTLLGTLIVNQFLLLFWEVNQLSTASGSQDMEFEQFGNLGPNFLPENGFCPLLHLITKSVLKKDPLSIPQQLSRLVVCNYWTSTPFPWLVCYVPYQYPVQYSENLKLL